MIPLSKLSGNLIDAHYVKAPEFGHNLEYVRPFADGDASWMNAVKHCARCE